MKFEIGDIVHYEYKNWGKGKIIGTKIDPIQYCIEFEERIYKGHDGNELRDDITNQIIRGKNNHCWYVFEEGLELIQKCNKNRRIMEVNNGKRF